MSPEPPLTLLTCEACEGYGCEVCTYPNYHPDDPNGQFEARCSYCDGFGAIVIEGETDTEQGEWLGGAK